MKRSGHFGTVHPPADPGRFRRGLPCSATPFTVDPIGHVAVDETDTSLMIAPRLQGGLDGLDGFSHVQRVAQF